MYANLKPTVEFYKTVNQMVTNE